LEPESQWIPKVVTCCLAALIATILAGILGSIGPGRGFVFRGSSPDGLRLWLSLAIPMFLVDWGRVTSPKRSKRLSLGSAMWIGLLGLISAAIFDQASFLVASVWRALPWSFRRTAYSVMHSNLFPRPKRSPKKPRRKRKKNNPEAASPESWYPYI